MNFNESIRSMAYLKAKTADVLTTVTETRSPVIITHNGEAKMVVQDFESYHSMRESLSMLKLVAMSQKQIKDGQTQKAETVFKALEEKLGI